jgi:hypothetical protein
VAGESASLPGWDKRGRPGAIQAFLPLNELPALFPHVASWISYLEKQAQESGRALSSIEFNLAQHVGLAHPEEVRILSVPRIPGFLQEYIQQIAVHGYLKALFELDAEAKATKACQDAGRPF